MPAGAQSSLDQTSVPPLCTRTVLGFVPTLRSHALSEMFLIDMVNVIGDPDGNDVPLSGFTVTSMSESLQAAPVTELDGLADDDELAEADADAVGEGDGAAVGAGSDEHERSSMKNTMRTTRAPRPTSRRRRQ